MRMHFYELEDNLDLEGRWYLNGLYDFSGRELDSRDLTYGKPVDLGPPLKISLPNEDTIVAARPPLRVPIRRKGTLLDFTYADFDLPVVTAKVGKILAEIAGADIQKIPVRVDSCKGDFEIVNITSCLPCIDPKRSEIEWWTNEDGRPDKIGMPRMITDLVIDQDRVKNSHVLRPQGWEVIVIVSEVVKAAFQEAHVTGVKFRAVSPG